MAQTERVSTEKDGTPKKKKREAKVGEETFVLRPPFQKTNLLVLATSKQVKVKKVEITAEYDGRGNSFVGIVGAAERGHLVTALKRTVKPNKPLIIEDEFLVKKNQQLVFQKTKELEGCLSITVVLHIQGGKLTEQSLPPAPAGNVDLDELLEIQNG